MVTSPEKRWRARPGGGASRKDPDRLNQELEDDEGLESGDCDDEDECTGVSGLGPPTRRKRLRVFAGQLNFFYCFRLRRLNVTYVTYLNTASVLIQPFSFSQND